MLLTLIEEFRKKKSFTKFQDLLRQMCSVTREKLNYLAHESRQYWEKLTSPLESLEISLDKISQDLHLRQKDHLKLCQLRSTVNMKKSDYFKHSQKFEEIHTEKLIQKHIKTYYKNPQRRQALKI